MIPHTSHPAPALNKVEMLFTQLDTAGYSLSAKVQAMLLLTNLPAMMDVVAQMIAQVKDSTGKAKKPTVAEIHSAVVLSWDQCHMLGKGKAPAQANKISTVKPHKGKEPSFQQQQQNPPTPQQVSSSTSGKKKKTHRSNPKKQEKQTAHLASYAEAYSSFVSNAILTPAVADLHLLASRPASLYQGQEGPATDPQIKQAFSLPKRLEIHPSCETIHSRNATITVAATDEMVVMPNAFGTLELPPGSPISYSCPQTPTPDLETNPWLPLAERIHEVAVQIETPPMKSHSKSPSGRGLTALISTRSCLLLLMNGTLMTSSTSMDPMESMSRSRRLLDSSWTRLG